MVLIWALLIPQMTLAADDEADDKSITVKVKADVDRKQMRPGETFTYFIEITSRDSTSFDQPQLPDLSAFVLGNAWSRSEMRGTFVNGQVQTQRSQTFYYKLSPMKEGAFTIGAAEVVVNGQIVRTNPISIEVSPGAVQGPSQAQGLPSDDDLDNFEDDIFSQLLRRRIRPPPRAIEPTNPNDAYFIHVEVDKDKVYQGEQVTATWYLVTRAQIADIDTLKYPSLSGFWKEDIEVATRLNFQPEIINGVQYHKALLASYALFPIKPGTASIDSYKAKCRILGHSLIGFPQEAQIVKESPVSQITVLPLPEAGKTALFTGGVGEFTVSGKVDSQSVKANSPVTLKVRVEGRGNAKVIDLPKFDLPPSVQVYDTKSETKFFANGRSYKEFETLLVPKTPGELKIPPVQFSFFNPAQKNYYTQSTSEFSVRVEPPEGGVIPSQQMNSPEVKTTEKKLVLPGLLLTMEHGPRFSPAQQLGGWSLLFGLTIAGLSLFAYRETGSRDKKEDLRRQIKRRLLAIEDRLGKGDWRGVGVESTNLIYSVLGEIAGLGGAAFEFDKLIEKSPPSFKRQVAPKIKDLVAKLEVIGFAPEEVVGKWREKSELKKLLSETEKLLAEAAKYDFTSVDQEANSV